MGAYLEFEFDGVECASGLLIVIKHTYVDSEEEKESATQVRKQIATQAVAYATYPKTT